MAAMARTPVSANIPGTPIQALRTGPATSDAANVPAMVMPMIAMARVRTPSRVRSAVSEMTAAEMAPAPCRHRPAMTQPIERAHAERNGARASNAGPIENPGFAPQFMGPPAEGVLQHRLKKAVGTQRDADQ